MTELPQLPPRCMHLQSKAMAVHGEGFENDADYQDGLANFWCVMSATGIGPDYGEVGVTPCSDPERDCYQEY